MMKFFAFPHKLLHITKNMIMMAQRGEIYENRQEAVEHGSENHR